MAYPGSLDSFTANVDGVDDVLAADVNELQAAIVAIETELGTDPAGTAATLIARLAHSINDAGMLEFDGAGALTIASGAVTVTQNFHKIDTEAAGATDDLDTINGNTDGFFLIIRSTSDARNVVIKHDTGNIYCSGAADITLDYTNQFAFGVYDDNQSKWLLARGAGTTVLTTDAGAGDSFVAVYTDATNIEGTDNLQWNGTTFTIGDGTATRDYIFKFDGETTDGIITWMEDEDYFKYSDGILMNTTEEIFFRDTAISIKSADDGHLDLTADVSIDLNTATDTDLVVNFAGTSNSGVFTWMEDEDYFKFSDDVLMNAAEAVYFRDTAIKIASDDDGHLDLHADVSIDLNTTTDTDLVVNYVGTSNSGVWTWMEDEAYFKSSAIIRAATTLYRRYYHIPVAAVNPGASGATWTAPSANTLGGWQLDAASEVLYLNTDVHSDWDAASNLTMEVKFEVNADNSGGGVSDTVDLKAVLYYKGNAETACKTQTVEVPVTVGASAQYKRFTASFTIDYDASGNVVEAGDVIRGILNLETDTSEVDNIIVNSAEFYYATTHLGIEAADV